MIDREARERIKNKVDWIPLLTQNGEYDKAVEDCEKIIGFFKNLRDKILEKKIEGKEEVKEDGS